MYIFTYIHLYNNTSINIINIKEISGNLVRKPKTCWWNTHNCCRNNRNMLFEHPDQTVRAVPALRTKWSNKMFWVFS